MKEARKAWDPAATAYALPFAYGGYIMDDIVQLVSTVGFPICMCLLLFFYMKSQLDVHKEESNGLKEAISKLEIAITALISKLDK